MPLPSPNLDDRDFDQLVKQARLYIEANCSHLTDFSAGDPGIVLIEAFAYLTETMIYRMNRVPEKSSHRIPPPHWGFAYAALSCLGRADVQREPPCRPGHRNPSRHACDRGARRGRPGTDSYSPLRAPRRFRPGPWKWFPCWHIIATRCTASGWPREWTAGAHGHRQQAAIDCTHGRGLDLVVGVEALPAELNARVAAIEFNRKAYRIWRRVDNFAETDGDSKVYVADPLLGEIRFAGSAQLRRPDGSLADPRALGDAPADGREIRLSYRRGGGPNGNVASGTLTVMKDPIPGVQVTNPGPASENGPPRRSPMRWSADRSSYGRRGALLPPAISKCWRLVAG